MREHVLHVGVEVEAPYLHTTNDNKRAETTRNRRQPSAGLRYFATDLLSVWDAASVLCCGLISASIPLLQVGDPTMMGADAGQIATDMYRLTVAGSVLSPFALRERSFSDRSAVNVLLGLSARAAGLVSVVLLLSLVLRQLPNVPAGWASAWFVLIIGSGLVGRLLLTAVLARSRERVAILGTGLDAYWLRTTLRQPGAHAPLVVGPSGGAAPIQALLGLGRAGGLDRIVLALPSEQARDAVHALKELGVEIASLHPLPGAIAPRATSLAGVPLFLVTARPAIGYAALLKGAFDRVAAVLLLLWTLPVFVLVALAIRLDSPGPVFFRQRRHGQGGTEFDIVKFRTMTWQGRRAGDGAVQTERHDRRITRIGRFLRQSSLDELPQLLNVLSGTMSLVGPRPHPVAMRTEDQPGSEIVPDYAHRHRVKPGITGWAQVNGLRGATDTAEQLRRRVECDNFYIDHWSPWFDLRILLQTPICLLFRRENAF